MGGLIPADNMEIKMKSSKKSETIEIRLSYEDKQALQGKASKDGKTVSSVVRGLINEYVSKDETRFYSNWLKAFIMTLKSKPKSIAATLLTCSLAPFAFVHYATAEDISVKLDGAFIVPIVVDGEQGSRTRSFSTEVHFDNGGETMLNLTPDMTMLIKVKQSGDSLFIEMAIKDNDKLIAEPKLTTQFDTPIRVEIGTEAGETFTLNALPEKL